MIDAARLFLGGPGSRPDERRPVLRRHIVRMLLQAALGEVDRESCSPTPLLMPHCVQPPCGGMLLGFVEEPLG